MSTKQAATFFRSRWVDAPAGAEQLDPAVLAPGFRAAGAHCGLKGAGETDVGILACADRREGLPHGVGFRRETGSIAMIQEAGAVVDRGIASRGTSNQLMVDWFTGRSSRSR